MLYLFNRKKLLFFLLFAINLNNVHITKPFYQNQYNKKNKSFREEATDMAMAIIILTVAAYIQIKMHQSLNTPQFKVYEPGEMQENFNSVAGNHEAKEALADIVAYLKNPSFYNSIGAKPPKGILFTGAPGTGKTLLARALAGEANCSFIYASGSEFNTMYVGSGSRNIRNLFYQARNQYKWCYEYFFLKKPLKRLPCIIFIDEIEVLARQRGFGDNYGDQSVNELLTQLDGFVQDNESPVIVIAATNFPEKLDKALTRPGRMDRIIHFNAPNLGDRIQALKIHLQKISHDENINLKSIAQRTIGFSGADLAEIIQTAARIAANKKSTKVIQQDLEEALDIRTIGIASNQPLSDKERKTIAYHEAGHALIGMLTLPNRSVNKITIIPRGQTLGITHFLHLEELAKIATKEECLNLISMTLGGRAAEDVIFNIISTGPISDLQSATNIAETMIKHYGMGNQLLAETNTIKFDSKELNHNINSILQEQYLKTKNLLLKNIDSLHCLANALLDKETLYEQDIASLHLSPTTI
ncbi:AAA family ATPase [Candidatus Dependentiae bacterium]|nr:AAA family ATPase [Candidatus Dependentiae bacterium]